MELEQSCFELILHSGNSKSTSMEIIDLVKKFDFVMADERLKEAKEELLLAQRKHAELLRDYASGKSDEVNMLLVHAEDHVLNAELSYKMASELYDLYKMVGEMKNGK